MTSESVASESVAVAVAQFAPGSDQAENLAGIARLATEAARRGAALVVFPEYSSFFTPVLGEESVRAAEPLDGRFVSSLAAMAASLKVHLVVGMLESTTGGDRFSNTIVALSPEGELIAKYRKIHLYDAFGQRESDWVEPGPIEEPETFQLGGLRVGIQTCYDLRFPEATRRLADAGADLVLLPAEWVRGPLKEYHWRTLVCARAIENTLYVAAAGQAPPVGVGNSMIVDPMGVVLAGLGEETDAAVAWISRTRLREVRATNPALSLRRFGVTSR